MNSVQLMGYLTNDVELRYTQNGNPVANFGMAMNRSYRQNDEKKTETTFVDLVAFNRTAEVAKRVFGQRPSGHDRRPASLPDLGDRGWREAFQAGSGGQPASSDAAQRQGR